MFARSSSQYRRAGRRGEDLCAVTMRSEVFHSIRYNFICHREYPVRPLSVITFLGKIEIRLDPAGKIRVYTDECDRPVCVHARIYMCVCVCVCVSGVGVRTSERCVCIQLHSEYTRIYLLKARRTLGVLETLLSLRLDTRSFPLMFSYSEAVYRLFPTFGQPSWVRGIQELCESL